VDLDLNTNESTIKTVTFKLSGELADNFKDACNVIGASTAKVGAALVLEILKDENEDVVKSACSKSARDEDVTTITTQMETSTLDAVAQKMADCGCGGRSRQKVLEALAQKLVDTVLQ
jgi:hypothetical protein